MYAEEAPRFIFSSRFGMAVLGFLGFFTMSSQKMCLQIALVCMVNETAAAILDGETLPSYAIPDGVLETNIINTTAQVMPVTPTVIEKEKCGVAEDVFKSYVKVSWFEDLEGKGTLVWDSTKRSVIFRVYYVGYMFSQIPAGLLAQKFGGKRVLAAFLLAASIATMLTPFGIRYHYFLLVFLRFIGGVGAGAAFPAMHCLLGRWAPPYERSKLASISYAGALTGSLATYPITTSLCRLNIDGGWPLIFYVIGGAGVLWFVLWIMTASESPLDHKRISKEERKYIVAVLSKQANLEPTPHFHLPFGAMLSSLPFFAIVISNFAYDWGIYMFESVVPVYLHEILDMDLRKVTLFSMMPYVSLWICVIMSGIWSDQLRERGVIGTSLTRKIFELIGCIVPTGMTIGLGFLDCTQWKGAVAMVILGFSFLGFQYNGFLVNHLDVAPRYAAVLMGISNTFGSIAHFMAPLLVSVISTEGTKEQWQTIFLASGCLYLFGLAMFIICGSGDLQSWARDPEEQQTAPLVNKVIPKRQPDKIYNLELGSPEPDISRYRPGKQVVVPPSDRVEYQPLTPVNNIGRLSNGPTRQSSVQGLKRSNSNRLNEISPYATLPRTRLGDLPIPASSSSTNRSRTKDPAYVQGYTSLRKQPDVPPSFRKSMDDPGRQFLYPGPGIERKPSRGSRNSREISNRSSRNSTDMTSVGNKRTSRTLSDPYNDMSESII